MSKSSISLGLAKYGLSLRDQGVLVLAPMAAVAWADGNADVDEMEGIAGKQCKQMKDKEECPLSITDKGREFFHNSFMYQRPDVRLMEECLTMLADVLSSMTEDKADALREVILVGCVEVAKTSGGLLGFSKVSTHEREVLKDLAARLRLRRAVNAYDELAKLGI
ncbi:MAG: hypothetical protein K9N51_07205 [Candidatus Pacebacteria bacterium]|nr:hypothetical protein [Candidatus Paceibacterota bacterium]